MDSHKKEYQKVIDYLCSMIENGELKIGSRLPTERSISETLSISRNSTREALRVLENMGIIQSRQGSGNYIVNNTMQNIVQIIDMMLMLKQTNFEEICSFRRNMEKAVCMSIIEKGSIGRWKSELEEQLDRFDSAQDVAEQIEADRGFHDTLILATENHFWIALLEAVTRVYRRWINEILENADSHVKHQLAQCHADMLSALCSGNLSDCMKAIDRHYDLVDKEMNRREEI